MDIVSSQIVYHGRVFDVRIDQVRLPNGNLHQMDIVQHHPAVTMIPFDQEGKTCGYHAAGAASRDVGKG